MCDSGKALTHNPALSYTLLSLTTTCSHELCAYHHVARSFYQSFSVCAATIGTLRLGSSGSWVESSLNDITIISHLLCAICDDDNSQPCNFGRVVISRSGSSLCPRLLGWRCKPLPSEWAFGILILRHRFFMDVIQHWVYDPKAK